jgi:hypothetical protein
MKVYPNGAGESQGGDVLCTQSPLFVGGNVWWVNSATGVDAGGTAGQDREKPLATLGQAVTNSANGDVIYLQSGHTETLTVAQNIGIRSVVGVGTTSGKPSVQMKINAAAAGCLTAGGQGCEIKNIYFPAAVQSDTTAAAGKVWIPSTPNVLIYGCYFESSGLDQLAALQIDVSSNGVSVEKCTFVSTATAVATRPTRGLYVSGAVSDLSVISCVFDDGTVGYSSKACDLSGGTITRLKAHSNSTLRGADVSIASASTGYFIPSTRSGGGAVNW